MRKKERLPVLRPVPRERAPQNARRLADLPLRGLRRRVERARRLPRAAGLAVSGGAGRLSGERRRLRPAVRHEPGGPAQKRRRARPARVRRPRPRLSANGAGPPGYPQPRGHASASFRRHPEKAAPVPERLRPAGGRRRHPHRPALGPAPGPAEAARHGHFFTARRLRKTPAKAGPMQRKRTRRPLPHSPFAPARRLCYNAHSERKPL